MNTLYSSRGSRAIEFEEHLLASLLCHWPSELVTKAGKGGASMTFHVLNSQESLSEELVEQVTNLEIEAEARVLG